MQILGKVNIFEKVQQKNIKVVKTLTTVAEIVVGNLHNIYNIAAFKLRLSVSTLYIFMATFNARHD